MAGVREIVQDAPREITCGICKGFCSESVTLVCGHSFCRECLPSKRRAGAIAFSCPECRHVPQEGESPVVNEHFAQVTERGRPISSQVLQNTERHSHCAIHKEVFQLFCEDDQKLLCVRCSQSPEHEAHKLSPIEKAASHCREKIQHVCRQLQMCFEEAKKRFAEEQRPVVDWHSMIATEYSKLHEFLLEEEFQSLERIKKEEGAWQDRLSQNVKTLQYFKLELQEARNQYNLDLLHDIKQLLGRSHTMLSKKAKPVTPELRQCRMPAMIDILSQFRVALSMDPTSASPYVILSEDLRSVKAGEGWEVDTENPENLAAKFVFAEQAFSSGIHYWEVDVTQLPQWILGVHAPQGRRNRSIHHGATKFLLQCVKKEEDYYLQTYPGSLNHQVKGPLPRVGVYLECIPGTLIFYNVLQRSLIYRFHSIPFTEPVTPIFCPGPPLPGTKAGPMTLCSVNSHLCACCY